MDTTSQVELPQEIIDKILDYVALQYEAWPGENLLHCVVSRSFRRRSLSWIFSSILIRGEPELRTRKIEALLDMIQRNPTIALHVEELRLDCTNHENAWITNDAPFVEVMKKISSPDRPIRRLVLEADTFADDGDETMSIEYPGPFLHDFFLPFIAPTVTSLALHRILNMPLAAITSCVNLVDLELLHVELAESEEDGSRCCKQSLQLRSLTYRLAQLALQTLLELSPERNCPGFDLSRLKSLTVYTDTQTDLAFEQEIVNASQDSLVELYILTMQTDDNEQFHGAINLGALSNLRLLHVHALFPQDGLSSICRTLSTVRSHSLHSFFIEAKIAYCDLSEPEVIFDADWSTFCSEVSRVMSNEGSGFEFKMTYRYRDNANMELEHYEALLNRQCQLIMNILRREKLASLLDNARFPVSTSHSLDFDFFYEYAFENSLAYAHVEDDYPEEMYSDSS
ncbi:hypothetical protein CVT26_006148 [Gymnopilus dilepis]|uniref:F-box domain-containing protein n=1 Tax=Gymnopilus dilepis TaxID=231916 RepID=A0A409WGB0_9AGAR|nr:hypothetical protein CVT26_006148 [Gymnopilus dilepis]